MEKKNKIIIAAIIIALVILCSGLTYAYFTSIVNSESGSTIIAKGGTMNVIYDNGSGDIVVENIYPREKEWVTKKFTVTGNNTTDLNMYYRISMAIDNNEFIYDDGIILSYTLTSENTSNNGEVIPSVTSHKSIINSEYTKAIYGNENQVIGQGMFAKGQNQVHTYTLKIFFDDSGSARDNVFQGKSFAAHLVIDSVNENGDIMSTGDENIFAYTVTRKEQVSTFKVISNINAEQEYKINLNVLGLMGNKINYTLTSINEGNDGTTATEITNGEIKGDDRGTKISLGVGKLSSKKSVHSYTLTFSSAETENFILAAKVEIEVKPKYWKDVPAHSILAGMSNNYQEMESTKDDYGTSYYYTGEVEDNYVSFAGMCWRIVRTTGNKDIKLVLYNDDSSDCTLTGDALAFAKYDGTNYTTKFNEKANDNTYMGFMYGTPDSNTYAATHANTNKSTILQNLEAWYKLKLNSYTDKLADTIWCNDKSTDDLGYQKDLSYYGAYNRLKPNGTPSLICPNDNNGGKLSKFTVNDTKYGNGNLDYKIGLLTADEMYFASYKYNSASSYLKNNATNTYFTMSPGFVEFSRGIYTTTHWYSDAAGGLSYVSTNYTCALRPVISLKSDVMATGDGTASNPYVIN